MRSIFALAALAVAAPLHAQGLAVASAVYVERIDNGTAAIEPATRLASGDRVIAILTWNAPAPGRYTVVSAVPAELMLQRASRADVEVSTDGGRHWQRLGAGQVAPAGATHLRWQAGGDGRLSYRAVVR